MKKLAAILIVFFTALSLAGCSKEEKTYTYDNIEPLFGSVSSFLSDGKYGLIDSNGKIIHTPEYDEEYYFASSHIDIWGGPNREKYPRIYIGNHCMPYTADTDDNYEFYRTDKNEFALGTDIAGADWEFILCNSDNKLYIVEGSEAGQYYREIRINNKIKSNSRTVNNNKNGLQDIEVKGDNNKYYIATHADFNFKDWIAYNQTTSLLFTYKDGKMVIIKDNLGRCYMQNGFFAEEKNGKWAYYKEDGTRITDYIYDSCGSRMKRMPGESLSEDCYAALKDYPYMFHSGVCAVKRDGKFGYIDSNGNEFIKCQYEEARSVQNGGAWIKNNGVWSFNEIITT